MKRPIDPNLNDFENEELFDIAESDDTSVAGFKVQEAEESKNPDDYHAYQHTHHHSSTDDSSAFRMREKQYYSTGEHHHSSHSHHSSSHSSSSKSKKLPTAARIAIAILIIIVVLVVVALAVFFGFQHKGKSDLTNVTTETNYEEKISYNGHDYVYNDNIVSIAFIGVDKRDLGLEDDAVGTAGQADANIVLAIDTSTGEAKAIAIPRDTMVDVDLYSENNIFLRNEEMQLCLSYAYGNGTDTSAENVTTSISRILYNVPINKYFALDLNGIEPINDAIGGVTVESLYDFDSLGISKGDTVHLIGDLTETYVRTRDWDTIEASLNRTARQVQYVKAFAAQVVPAVMNDFSIVSSLYNTAMEYSTTNITLTDATYLASLMISKNITDFTTTTIEGEMKESTREEYSNVVYAEFYPDEDKLMETVLDTFYTQID